MVDEAIEELKQQLINAWDHAAPEINAETSRPRFQALPRPRRPRAGLAIGHAFEGGTGNKRLELRVTAESGPSFAHAQKLAATARAQGYEAVVRWFRKPSIKLAPAVVVGAGLRSGTGSWLAARCRPLHLGMSVGHEKGEAGSLGAFVLTEQGHPGFISCTHVLARWKNRSAEIGDKIHQPGPPDQDPYSPANTVGHLTEYFAPFIQNRPNNLDAAIAKIRPDGKLGPLINAFPDRTDISEKFRGRSIGKELNPEDIEIGTQVVKLGRSSHFTDNARVSAIEFRNLNVTYGTDDFTFSSAIELQWDEGPLFTKPGDSGALVLTEGDFRPIGIHFAASEEDRLSYVMPIKRICDTWSLKLLREPISLVDAP